MKIRKSVADRFRVTKNGKVLRASNFNRHLKSSKSKSQVRRLRRTKNLETRMARNIKKILGK